MVYYNDLNGVKLSALGFGTMRLPLNSSDPADIDQAQVEEMTDYAIKNGINYFDTAYPYHDGASEISIGKALSKYPRDSFYLATKFPGHQIMSEYDCEGIFNNQLKKCGVDYFDFYLLHNVNEGSIGTYLNREIGIPEYFIKMRDEGKIKHLGFSCHGDCNCINQFLDAYGDELEFCQIQLNYLDWTLQDAKSKYELLTQRGLGVWVMEPVHGGKLANLDTESEEILNKLRPGESNAAWAFRFLQGLPNVKVVLSGMSSIDQMKDNVATFAARKPLNGEETDEILKIAEKLKNAVPCTGCRYCCHGCPMQIDIPRMIAMYNEAKFYPSFNISMRVDAVEAGHRPEDCIGCGQCAQICPQGIDVPSLMPQITEEFKKLPDWAELCRHREEMAKKNSK